MTVLVMSAVLLVGVVLNYLIRKNLHHYRLYRNLRDRLGLADDSVISGGNAP